MDDELTPVYVIYFAGDPSRTPVISLSKPTADYMMSLPSNAYLKTYEVDIDTAVDNALQKLTHLDRFILGVFYRRNADG